MLRTPFGGHISDSILIWGGGGRAQDTFSYQLFKIVKIMGGGRGTCLPWPTAQRSLKNILRLRKGERAFILVSAQYHGKIFSRLMFISATSPLGRECCARTSLF